MAETQDVAHVRTWQQISIRVMGFSTHGGTTQARTGDPLRVRQMQYAEKCGLSGPHESMSANGHQNGATHAGQTW